MNKSTDLLVIGGGLHGLSAALQSARLGLKVTVVERDFVGRHASGSTAAGVRTLGRAVEELPLSLEAAETWHHMVELVGDDCGFRAAGQLQVAEDEAALAAVSARVHGLESAGMSHERLLGADDLRAIIPDLPPHCLGGAWVSGDGSADPHRTIRAFRAACEKAGVRIIEECRVSSLKRRGGIWSAQTEIGVIEAPLVINAAGAWASNLAKMAGECVSHEIRTSMMIVTERVHPRIAPVVGSFGRKLSFKQTTEGTILLGGGAQGKLAKDRNSSSVDMVALSETAQTAVNLFPWVKGLRIVRTWAGMEAMTRDHIPVLGWSPELEGMIHAFGFSGHGFQLVPSVGRALAQLAAGMVPAHELSAFSSSRLAK
ncbi:FAD-dependent oxidoreductase [Metarhizobium album]|uniref:FAD-dependent oxidoreductase n=1 Tax=Metarhizobium album TaxID=2182425 RepID=A0A2U2DK70_9HYPH|nr:FAD-dependent oxidoreductase [Rhizobium album]PWE53707.1 FAD-dependent oxidoreductase [Rhizobium album]